MKNIFYLTFMLCLTQCKDNDVWPNNFEGKYTLDFTVTQRPALFWQDMNPTFTTELMYGEYLDLSQNVCCEPMPPTKEHGCPMEYSRSDFEIFKKDGDYFLKNRIVFDDEGNQINFDIPLAISDNTLKIKSGLNKNERFFKRNAYIGDDDLYPLDFEILDLEFHIDGTKITSGNWKIIDLFGQRCYLKRDGYLYRYLMVEFANFKAEKQ